MWNKTIQSTSSSSSLPGVYAVATAADATTAVSYDDIQIPII